MTMAFGHKTGTWPAQPIRWLLGFPTFLEARGILSLSFYLDSGEARLAPIYTFLLLFSYLLSYLLSSYYNLSSRYNNYNVMLVSRFLYYYFPHCFTPNTSVQCLADLLQRWQSTVLHRTVPGRAPADVFIYWHRTALVQYVTTQEKILKNRPVPGRLSNLPVMCTSLKSYDVSFICDHSITITE